MNDIANNIVAFMCDKEELSSEAASFICNWVLTDRAEKTKKMYDTWDIILKNYLTYYLSCLFKNKQKRNTKFYRKYSLCRKIFGQT